MLWIIICAAVGLIYAFGAFIDNYITDVYFKNKKPQSIKAINGWGYLLTALAVFTFGNVEIFNTFSIAMLMLAGVITSLGSIPYYISLKDEEATAVAIFYQLLPVIIFIADFFLFGETFKPQEILGFILVMAAPAIIILSTKSHSKRRKREMRGAFYILLYILTIAISTLITTHVGDNAGGELDYLSVFFYFILGRALSDIILSSIFKSWRKRIRQIIKTNGKKSVALFLFNQAICIIADFLSRYAFIIGIAAVASVIENAAELIFTFILGIILSIIWPNFGREKLDRRTVISHLVAIIFAVAGVIILQ